MTMFIVPCYAQKSTCYPDLRDTFSENRISGKSHMQVQQEKIICLSQTWDVITIRIQVAMWKSWFDRSKT